MQTGDRIVVGALGEDAALTHATPTGAAFVLEQSVDVNKYSTAYVWKATATTTGTITVSAAVDGGRFHGFTVWVFRGSAGFGVSGKANGSGAPSVALTCAANSAVVVVASDWNAIDGTSRVWRSGVESTYFRDAARYTVYAGVVSDVGTAGSKTVGLSAPSGQKFSVAAVEVLAGAGGVVTEATGVLPATVGATSTASAVRALGGAVPLSAGLGSLSASVMRASGSTPVTAALSGSAVRVAVAAGTLPMSLALASSSVKVASASGTLSATLTLTGNTSSGTTTSGLLPLTVDLHGVSSRVAQATGTLPITAGMSGASVTDNTVTGVLPLHITGESTGHMIAYASGVLPGFIAVNGLDTMRDITATGSLNPRRWTGTQSTRTMTATLTRRRWEGHHD
ncbi:hypothetical protein [Cryobacterium sp. BB736]|uniref:hypothetical protein n=1 Tax=Cryobacterium sp. BB736 TaxID=2746963 RepID=UPI001875B1DF|nr:hypothetical protein [Cryobacterium sp. BB736]